MVPSGHLLVCIKLRWSALGDVEQEAERAAGLERERFSPSLVAMVFSFHTIEAYVNFAGEYLAPEMWSDARNYFRNEPYRGRVGKLRKVMDLVDLSWAGGRPLKTILQRKELRDYIAHGHSEDLVGLAIHENDAEIPHPVSTLKWLVAPKDKLAPMVADVEAFLNEIHTRIKPRVNTSGSGARLCAGRKRTQAEARDCCRDPRHPGARSLLHSARRFDLVRRVRRTK